MTRPHMSAVALVATATLTLAACGRSAGGSALPDGSYAGSNAAQVAVTVQVSSGQVSSYDGHKTNAAPNGAAFSRRYGITLLCKSALRNTELICSLRGPKHTESIELMKL